MRRRGWPTADAHGESDASNTAAEVPSHARSPARKTLKARLRTRAGDVVNANQERAQTLFRLTLSEATEELGRRPDPKDFALWALDRVRGIQRRELRHVAMDAIVAACEEREES